MEEVEARYAEVVVNPGKLAAARALGPMERAAEAFGMNVLLFQWGGQATAWRSWARCARRGTADVFVAVIGI